MAEDTHVERFVADVSAFVRDVQRAAKEADHFGNATSGAGLAARKMGLAAAEAGEKAARAQKEAADAAERLAKGELGADRAAQLTAKALREVERASIKQAEAARLDARAINEQADQYRKLARDAELAAGVERLAWLKNSGAASQHNKLLKDLRTDYGDLGRDATKAFEEMEVAGANAFSGIGSMGPVTIGAIVAGLALLPAAATLAGGAITAGLGGAFTLVGLKATEGSATAQHAIDDMKSHTLGVVREISRPFEQTWVNIANAEKTALDGMEPDLHKLFATLAPEVSSFANEVGRKIPGELHGFFQALEQDSGPIISELGSTLPHALGLAADGVKQIMDEVAKNPQEFGNMVNAAGQVAQALGTMVTWTIKAGEGLSYLNSLNGKMAGSFHMIGEGLGVAGGAFTVLGNVMDRFDLSAHKTIGDLASIGWDAVAAGAAKAAQAIGGTTQAVGELDKAITAYLDPQLAVFDDTTRLKQEFIDLRAAMKGAKDSLDGNSVASRRARDSFSEALKTTKDLALETEKMTGSHKKAGEAIKAYIGVLWQMAGTSKSAQQEVMTLATLFGVALPTQGRKGKGAVDGVRKSIEGLHSKTVDIKANTSAAEAAIERLRAMAGQPLPAAHFNALGGPIYPYAEGGAIGLAAGGQARSMPNGGGVWGPGTSTSDDIPVWASNGEYMVNAASYAANRQLVEAINSSRGKPVLGGQKSGSTLGSGVHSAVLHAMPLARRHYAETLTGSSGGSSQVVHHNYYIAGSVWSEQELLNTLQRVAFERGIDFNRPSGR